MTDPRETLARIRAQADAATEGPWEHDPPPGPGEDPMRPICVYPKEDGGTLAYVQPLEADAEFIAASRTTVPALVDALEKVLELHPRVVVMAADPEFGQMEDEAICGACIVDHEAADWPCPNVTAVTTALEAIK